MTKTTQPRTWKIGLYETDNDLQKQKPEREDNLSLFLLLLDNLNDLYKNLSKLNYLIQKRNLEQMSTE
jgi:hypothetical protein